jgi:cytochrome d ubiquinol oxidase subunit II
MSLELFLAGSILVSLVFYVLLGGADYGGGVWDLLAFGSRAEAQRRLIANAVGPVWEANHVWLILIVVILFTAFPAAFGRLSIVFHIPLSLALVGIVLRGCAFTFRTYCGPSDQAQRRWGRVFAIASLVTPVLMGTVLGGVYAGRAQMPAWFIYSWLSPFPVSVGMFTLCLFAYLAATYLTIESSDHPDLQQAFRVKALLSGIVTILVGVAVLLIEHKANVELAHRTTTWVWVLRTVTFTVAAGALWALTKYRFRTARILVAMQVGLIVVSWGINQYPYLVPPDVTVHSAAAPHPTLLMLTAALAVGAALLFPSFYYLFYVFKGSLLTREKP